LKDGERGSQDRLLRRPVRSLATSLVPSVNVIVLTARPVSGTPTPSEESTQFRWVPVSGLPGYPMDRSMRIRVNDYLRGDPRPVVN
jgi:hypothetical protein